MPRPSPSSPPVPPLRRFLPADAAALAGRRGLPRLVVGTRSAEPYENALEEDGGRHGRQLEKQIDEMSVTSQKVVLRRCNGERLAAGNALEEEVLIGAPRRRRLDGDLFIVLPVVKTPPTTSGVDDGARF